MRRIIFKSLAVITLIAIIGFAWVGAGERLSPLLAQSENGAQEDDADFEI